MADIITLHDGRRRMEYSLTETAVEIRAAMKRAFPGVKFSVRSRSYSMGCSIDVRWTDWPIEAEVDVILDSFRCQGFDGMTDSTTYWHQERDGMLIRYGGGYIHARRELSPELEARARRIAELKGLGDEWWQVAHMMRPNGCLVRAKTEAGL